MNGSGYEALTPQRLGYFLAVSRERSFRKAAESVYLAQSAFTTHIDTLEEVLGVTLFARTQRGVTLTSAGEQLIPHAERVLERISRLAEFADGLQAGSVGTLTIACYPVHVERFLGTVIERYLATQPRVNFDLTQMRDDRRREAGRSLFDELRDGDVDLAMGPPHQHLGGIGGFEAYVARIVALVPDDHPARFSPTISIRDLANQRLLVAPSGYFSRTRLELAARAANVPLLVGGQSSSPPALMVLGKAGVGIPVLPDDYPLVGQHDHPFPTVTDGEDQEIATPVWLQWRSDDSSRSALATGFIEVAREVMREEAECGRIRQDYYHVIT